MEKMTMLLSLRFLLVRQQVRLLVLLQLFSTATATTFAAASSLLSSSSSSWFGIPEHGEERTHSKRLLCKVETNVPSRPVFTIPRGGGSSPRTAADEEGEDDETTEYGRISETEYRLTQGQIDAFHRDGCITLENVLTDDEVDELQLVFDRFVNREIEVPGKDFCDMSKPFGIPYEQWSIVNCMLPTTYHPPLRNNVFERITQSIAQQLFATKGPSNTPIPMAKDYDQFLNKRPGKSDAVFAWHQDMAYWPGTKALGPTVHTTATCTFSLAIDDSTLENGCLRYVAGSGTSKTLRPHRPACGTNRDDGHALVVDLVPTDEIRTAPAKRGSITIHDEYVVHGSSGNNSPNQQRRTYVLAYRAKEIVDAERAIGFTHSHNDDVNWDTFQDDESHRVKSSSQSENNEQEQEQE